MTTINEEKPQAATIDATLDKMAKWIHGLAQADATGPLAALRRLDTQLPTAPAFQQLLAQCVSDHLFRSKGAGDAETGGATDMMRRFARVAQIMAMRPDALQRYELGAALYAAGVSPGRLSMLLTARGATFDDLARRTARRLAQSAEKLPYNELSRLLLYEGRAEHARKADDIRLRVAGDYQRAARNKGETEDSNENNSDRGHLQ